VLHQGTHSPPAPDTTILLLSGRPWLPASLASLLGVMLLCCAVLYTFLGWCWCKMNCDAFENTCARLSYHSLPVIQCMRASTAWEGRGLGGGGWAQKISAEKDTALHSRCTPLGKKAPHTRGQRSLSKKMICDSQRTPIGQRALLMTRTVIRAALRPYILGTDTHPCMGPPFEHRRHSLHPPEVSPSTGFCGLPSGFPGPAAGVYSTGTRSVSSTEGQPAQVGTGHKQAAHCCWCCLAQKERAMDPTRPLCQAAPPLTGAGAPRAPLSFSASMRSTASPALAPSLSLSPAAGAPSRSRRRAPREAGQALSHKPQPQPQVCFRPLPLP